MAKWLKDYLSFGSKRMPPQPPKPDYTESEILKAYRVQKSLDFEDPYEDHENRSRNDDGSTEVQNAGLGSPLKTSALDMKVVSPKHRLIKVDSQDLGRTKILLSAVSLEESPEPVVPSAPAVGDMDYSDPFDARRDVQPESHAGTARPENNGYMEPYEAQRVLAELQRRAGGRGRGGVQLYDTPYEERGSGLAEAPEEGRESRLPQDDERPADEYDQPWEWKKEHISKAFAGERGTHLEMEGCGGGGDAGDASAGNALRAVGIVRSAWVLSTSHLATPADPVALCQHYMGQEAGSHTGLAMCSEACPGACPCSTRIAPEPKWLLTVHTELPSSAGSDMNGLPELPWPPPVGQLEEEPALGEQVQFECAEWDRSSSPDRTRSSRAALVSGSAKLRKPGEPAPVLGERVDPTLPLEKQVWYHGALSRSDAESLLTLCKESSYLVRNSESSHSEYSLSLRSCQGFMHMKFSQLKDGKYVLGQNSQPFGTIPEVIHYYTRHKLPIRGAEHLSLLFPVLVQTL
ncbi:hypothetical protein P4O66_013016 [Electrophorus voltai]|uniref:SH2 domain-containing protein n=1 Tax=Electrophorus voltai TaxID=2609070 RepID=A0AAD8ZVL9_9TELE|nr:hypothetical protein P4O66_013016 [Electrophorus voltai]